MTKRECPTVRGFRNGLGQQEPFLDQRGRIVIFTEPLESMPPQEGTTVATCPLRRPGSGLFACEECRRYLIVGSEPNNY